jgi:hypothetical protein
MQPTDETASYMAAKTTPPVAVAAANLISDSAVPHIVNLLTAIYLLLLIAHKGWTIYRDIRAAEFATKRTPATKDRRARPRTTNPKEEPE